MVAFVNLPARLCDLRVTCTIGSPDYVGNVLTVMYAVITRGNSCEMVAGPRSLIFIRLKREADRKALGLEP